MAFMDNRPEWQRGGRESHPAETAKRSVNQLGHVTLENDADRLRSINELYGEIDDRSFHFLVRDPEFYSRTLLVGAVPEIRSRYASSGNPYWKVSGVAVENLYNFFWLKKGLNVLDRVEVLSPDGRDRLKYRDSDFRFQFEQTPYEAEKWIERNITGRSLENLNFVPRRARRSERIFSGYGYGDTPSGYLISSAEVEQIEERKQSRGKGWVVLMSASGILVTVSAAACAQVTETPTSATARPATATFEIPTLTSTPEPFTLIEDTPTPEPVGFTPPVNPPEYIKEAAGGPFPESIQSLATEASYRALEIQRRADEGSFFVPEAVYYELLDEFREVNGYEVDQTWNGRYGDQYRMMTTLVRERNGIQEVRWFVTASGLFTAKPDGLPVGADPMNPPQAWVPLQRDTHADWRWGDDNHVYLYEVDNQSGEADKWFNSTEARAFTPGGVEQAFEAVFDPYEAGRALAGVERVVDLGDKMLAYGSGSMPLFEFNSNTSEWGQFVPEIGILTIPQLENIIPERMKTVLPLESSQHLRFTDAQGNPLPYGYIGYREYKGPDPVNPNWFVDDPRCEEGWYIHPLFHARLRGVVREYPEIDAESWFVVDMPIEATDPESGELVWTGDLQFMTELHYMQGDPLTGFALHGRNLGDWKRTTNSLEGWFEIMKNMPEGASIIFGVTKHCPVVPESYEVKIFEALRDDELISRQYATHIIDIFIGSSFDR